MPKRVLDGEAMWASSKLARAEPTWARAEYAWLYPLAGSNGVFEVDARATWAKCYAYARPEKTVEDVEVILQGLEKAKLLFVWKQDGKQWGYWTGCEKPGRLPRQSWRKRDAEKGRLGPDPTEAELRQFLAGEPATAARLEGTADTVVACKLHATKVPGFGSGSGIGSGRTSSFGTAVPNKESSSPPETKPPCEVAVALAGLLRQCILENNPQAKVTGRQVQKWAVEADRMMRLDGRSETDILNLIEWSQRDPFWSANILSMTKLREKWDQLVLNAGQRSASKVAKRRLGSIPRCPPRLTVGRNTDYDDG